MVSSSPGVILSHLDLTSVTIQTAIESGLFGSEIQLDAT